jgi:hypothetical protein
LTSIGKSINIGFSDQQRKIDNYCSAGHKKPMVIDVPLQMESRMLNDLPGLMLAQ